MSSRARDSQPAAGAGPAASCPDTADPAVSIVLPTYNRAPLIGRSIRSVLEQTYRNFELIVVDDGSTDTTAEEVARFADTRIRYLRFDQNRGAAAARNAGIRQAAGAFIAFQDSDDEWLPAKLACHMHVFATSAPDVGVVYSDMQRVRRDGSSSYHRSPDVALGVLIDPNTRFYQVCKLGIQSTVIRRECLTAVGGFDEEFPALEDLELFIRLSRRYRFHHLESPLVRYHETDGLSRNMPAKVVARALLLRLYQEDLAHADPGFVALELAWLRAAELPRAGVASGT
jgi:glycosyltransferase involved in cell wall biosynthesis